MESLKSSFLFSTPLLPPHSQPHKTNTKKSKNHNKPIIPIYSYTPSDKVHRDPWSPHTGDPTKPKPRHKHPKKPLSDDNARRIIKGKALYLSALRRNQGPQAQTPRWIKRTPEQMVQYLQDDRHGELYGKHVVAAIKKVRALSEVSDGAYDMRMVMGSFVGKLTFKEMCVVLKEQKGWRQVRDFFDWMKLQLSYHPSVIVYTIVLRLYGQVGKLNMAEEIFLEMLEAGCEPDEVACGTMLCSYARWGRHKSMLSFYSAVKERGLILSVAVFNFMLSSLQKKSLHKEVVHVWRDMVIKGVVPNDFTYTVVIISLVKEGLHEDAFKTFDEMKNKGFVPEELTYNMLINLNAKNGNRDEVQRLYEDMRFRRVAPSNYTCATLISLYYKYEDYPRVLSLFKEMARNKIPADEVIYGLLIRTYGKLGLYEDACKTFEKIKHQGLLTNEKTHLAMAQVHLSSGNVDKALEVIGLMKSKNILFSRFAYIVLLQCYVTKENAVATEGTFLALCKTGLPDAGSCNDVLNLYVRLNLMDKAKEFIVRIRDNGTNFDEELYRTVMMICCKEGMLLEAKHLTNQMVKNESFKNCKFFQTFYWILCEHKEDVQIDDKLVTIKPTDKLDTTALGMMLQVYLTNNNVSKTRMLVKLLLGCAGGSKIVNQLITSLTKDGEIGKAESLNHQLITLGCRMEEVSAASLISHYGKQHMLKQAEDIFAEYVNSPTSSKLVYNCMIDAYTKCGKQEKAYLLYKQATEEGRDLGPVGLSIVVNALTNEGKHREAENIISRSLEENLKLDTVAYNTFIKSMLKAGKLHVASSIFERMCSSGVAPSIQTYNTMISVYGKDQKLDRAVEMLNKARSLDVRLDERACMNLISYYGKAGMIHEASQLFSEMQEEGIKPGKISYDIMINVYANAGVHHEVEKLFQAMERQGCLPDSSMYLSLVQAYTESLNYSKAEETIHAMQSKGISPSCAHFIILLNALIKAGLIDEAKRVYEGISTFDVTPDLICYRIIMKGYLKYGRVEEGINFYESICNCKLTKGDDFVLSVAVHLYKSAGMESHAKEILSSMNKMRIPFLRKLEVGSGEKVKVP
ncbi:pentatricopeptide repeat-containing protein At5g27270 isoform X1 [Trifolium pratense]|uniref:pentatricopeptide repeat-containing protein At5g27270 isoform X1 n=2 Tax=Trifolium pratense TaxID=57577 RepID=UPI001E6942D1|nr:pentatricopeptide repeat-containing protein At5g27270 isoform X1 [Trifolium pratense]